MIITELRPEQTGWSSHDANRHLSVRAEGSFSPTPQETSSGRVIEKFENGFENNLEHRTSGAKKPDRAVIASESRTYSISPSNLHKATDPSTLLIREHFVRLIATELEKLIRDIDQTNWAMYINNIVRKIDSFTQSHRVDNFFEVLAAFRDSLIYKNYWAGYSIGQYEQALELLGAESKKVMNNKEVAKAIVRLEKAGFDTLPAELDGEFLLDEEDGEISE